MGRGVDINFIIKLKTVIDFYTAIFYLWWLERRIYSQCEMEKESCSSDY